MSTALNKVKLTCGRSSSKRTNDQTSHEIGNEIVSLVYDTIGEDIIMRQLVFPHLKPKNCQKGSITKRHL